MAVSKHNRDATNRVVPWAGWGSMNWQPLLKEALRYLPDPDHLSLTTRNVSATVWWIGRGLMQVETKLSLLCWFNFNLSYFLIQFIVRLQKHLCWHEEGDSWGLRINSKGRSRLLPLPPQPPFSNSVHLKCSWNYSALLCPAVLCLSLWKKTSWTSPCSSQLFLVWTYPDCCY